MTTISAGAAAGLLVALMVVSTTDGHGTELPAVKQANAFTHPAEIRGFNPQPDPPKIRAGDGSVRPAGV